MSRPAFAAALGDHPKGLRLDLFVSPGAGRSRFPHRYDPWRKRIGIRVEPAARNGRANREVIRLVAAFFGRDEKDVAILNGASTPQKTVVVQGVELAEAWHRLAGDLP